MAATAVWQLLGADAVCAALRRALAALAAAPGAARARAESVLRAAVLFGGDDACPPDPAALAALAAAWAATGDVYDAELAARARAAAAGSGAAAPPAREAEPAPHQAADL